jgi:phosphoserine phosphatase
MVREPNDRTVWEVLNERFTGRAEQNVDRYAKYRSGELSYAEWVALDVGGWQRAGATRTEIIAALAPLRLVDDTRGALETLKRAGYRLVVISGTLDLLLHTLLPHPPFDDIYANHIGFDDVGRISHWRATPFDMEGKAEAFRAVAQAWGIPLARCAYVGDSANDIWVAREAGFTLAFNPKSPELVAVADVTVRSSSLRSILPHFLDNGS